MSRAAAVGTGLVLAAAGCASEPHGLEWGFRFADPADAAIARTIEATILAGNCGTTTEIWRAEIRLDVGATMEIPPALAAGGYGFRGRALDGSCLVVALGCETEQLPRTVAEPLIVTLYGLETRDPACALDICIDGNCRPPSADGGRIDGGSRDGPPPPDDGGSLDANEPIDGGGMDSGATDSGPSDGCTPTTESCNGADDDCDGEVDEDFDLANDDANCGSCGNDCGEGSCSSGACGCSGGLYYTTSRRCVDTSRDPSYCGSSLAQCDDDEYCVGGSCVCRPGLTRDGSSCRDLSSDPINCGVIDRVCSAGQYCSSGSCMSSCGGALTTCGQACVDTNDDPLHCGSCTNTCNRDEICDSSSCERYRPAIGCSTCPCTSSCRGDYRICVMTYGSIGPICERYE